MSVRFTVTDPASRRTVESLYRDHIAAMFKYANEIEPVLGSENPIVKRIRSCAVSNREVLASLTEKQPCETCGTKSGGVRA